MSGGKTALRCTARSIGQVSFSILSLGYGSTELIQLKLQFTDKVGIILTRPDKTHHIVRGNFHAFRIKAIFHGWISLHDVSSLSHSPDVVDVAMLMFLRQSVSRFKDDHVTSVLECSADLGGVQSEL